jgi:hypothetical protein
MSASIRARQSGRVVLDHHDVLFLLRHLHVPIGPDREVLVVFILDVQSRVRVSCIIEEFPRFCSSAIAEVSELLSRLALDPDTLEFIACWCTDDNVKTDQAERQLAYLKALISDVPELVPRDLYWVQPSGFASLADSAQLPA